MLIDVTATTYEGRPRPELLASGSSVEIRNAPMCRVDGELYDVPTLFVDGEPEAHVNFYNPSTWITPGGFTLEGLRFNVVDSTSTVVDLEDGDSAHVMVSDEGVIIDWYQEDEFQPVATWGATFGELVEFVNDAVQAIPSGSGTILEEVMRQGKLCDFMASLDAQLEAAGLPYLDVAAAAWLDCERLGANDAS